MHARKICICFAGLLVSVLATAHAQTSDTSTSRTASPMSAQNTARRTARGPLPDPALLDGSTQQPEKHPDYGMLGQFEIPGDNNSNSSKVGGQQNPNQQGGGQSGGPQGQGGGQQGSMAGLPQGGGAGGGQQQANQGGAQGGGAQAGGPQAAGGGTGGSQQANPGGMAGGGPVGQGDPNAKADGIQVADLGGDAGGAGAGQDGIGGDVPKPQQVKIGDSAMQIKPAPNTPGVVGQVAAANSTQQMESKIGHGSGPGPSAGTDGRGNVEKGKVMPPGL